MELPAANQFTIGLNIVDAGLYLRSRDPYGFEQLVG